MGEADIEAAVAKAVEEIEAGRDNILHQWRKRTKDLWYESERPRSGGAARPGGSGSGRPSRVRPGLLVWDMGSPPWGGACEAESRPGVDCRLPAFAGGAAVNGKVRVCREF
jgi:hypothetical protein